jgi:F-type H+-transporting ATPase subunit alpha
MIKVEEISQLIKTQIKGFEKAIDIQEVGTVISVGDGIARIYGLEKAMAGELLEFPGNIYGMVLNLEEDNVGAAILGSDQTIKEGDTVKRTGKIVEVPVGRTPPHGQQRARQPIDDKGPIESTENRRSDQGPGMCENPFTTSDGSTIGAVPIGNDQKTIIGDRQTGKTAVALDTIINQGQNVFCIYVAIAQKQSTVAR